jgi:hypothetical protein
MHLLLHSNQSLNINLRKEQTTIHSLGASQQWSVKSPGHQTNPFDFAISAHFVPGMVIFDLITVVLALNAPVCSLLHVLRSCGAV